MTAQSVKWWSLVHKWTSLICTLFLLMLCITGLPLIFHDEIDDLFKSEASARDLPADTPQAPLSRLIDAAKARYPERYLQVSAGTMTAPTSSTSSSRRRRKRRPDSVS